MKIKYACGLLALSALSILLVPLPAQADGETLKWMEISKPGLSGNIVVSSSEVSEIAIGRGAPSM
jgi:hypothetical protein